MATPSRSQWVNLKKKNKVTDGAVKGVNMGKLLEDYDRAFKAGSHLGSIKELSALTAGARKYYDGIKPKMPAFAATFKADVLDEVLELQKVLERIGNPAHAYAETLHKCFTALTQLGDTPSKNQLDLFVSGPVRAVGAALTKLAAIDTKAAEIKHLWDPLDVIKTNDPAKAMTILKAAVPLVVKESKAYHLLPS